jgi:hypothetical protein
LDRTCSATIDSAIKQGFLRITLFYPVHMSGEFRRSSGIIPTGNPQYARDYRIERLLAPTSGELRRCVTNIMNAGLELTYIPHIESITTMLGKGENEWRIATLIPLDDPNLYAAAYAPVIDILNANSSKIRNHVTISIGAEVDRSAFYFAASTINLARKIKRNLSTIPPNKVLLSFNPNGDFYAIQAEEFKRILRERGETSEQVCTDFVNLLKNEVLSIGPSIYDRYSHVFPKREAQSRPNPEFGATRTGFLTKLDVMLNQICSYDAETRRSVITNVEEKFDIGEFSLQTSPYDAYLSRMDTYGYFLDSALQQSDSPHGRMNLWSDGNFRYDPLAKQGNAVNSQTAQPILDFVSCR